MAAGCLNGLQRIGQGIDRLHRIGQLQQAVFAAGAEQQALAQQGYSFVALACRRQDGRKGAAPGRIVRPVRKRETQGGARR